MKNRIRNNGKVFGAALYQGMALVVPPSTHLFLKINQRGEAALKSSSPAERFRYADFPVPIIRSAFRIKV